MQVFLPAYGMHIHGTLFKVYPSGIWVNPPLRVQSRELASGNTAILEAKWPWEGKYTFHFHGISEERGAIGYFNVTNAKAGTVDGRDISISKTINMNNWQMNLTKSLQKADPNGKITVTENTKSYSTNTNLGNKTTNNEENKGKINSNNGNSIEVSIVKDASAKGDKAFSPNPIKIKVGTTVTWTNNDNNIHTITSGKPNTPNAGELFDSGLTTLIMPSKTFSYKFANSGDFSYFCRLHPTMTGTIDVIP
ncbi:MAG TPA: plastocyanin/azurin family copper-binding protein [Candidatus Nitrosocosmicus sp.]